MKSNSTNRKYCKIHFIKALSGDSFLLEFMDGHCILIDCGYRSTYNTELKPLLHRLHNAGCKISLLVITHMDEDHIGGAIAFIEDNGNNRNPRVIGVDNIWFNGIFDVCRNYDFLCNHLVDILSDDDEKKNEFVRNEILKLIGEGENFVSANHAKAFETLCKDNGYHLNAETKNGLIMAGDKLRIGGINISVLSPSPNEVECFAKWINRNLISCLGKNYRIKNGEFIEYIEKMVIALAKDEEGSSGSEFICAKKTDIRNWIGTSTLAKMNEANRMSIVLEIEYDGKLLLFTGDSESEDWIERARARYDWVKLSHHGSAQPNLKLLQYIEFKNVLISTNGRKNHPENDILARLFMKKIDKVFFNYNLRQKEQILECQDDYDFVAHFEKNEICIE